VGESRTDRPRDDLDRLTVSQAAEVLGVSQDAVRKRIARGTIPHDRDESGRVHVYLSPSETVHKTGQDTDRDAATKTVQDAYIRSLEDQIAFLRREVERKDAILLRMAESIPQLEAPSEARESPETPSEGTANTAAAPEPETPAEPRPWWRRMFGGQG
jgi:excisionase family DNA binding protein